MKQELLRKTINDFFIQQKIPFGDRMLRIKIGNEKKEYEVKVPIVIRGNTYLCVFWFANTAETIHTGYFSIDLPTDFEEGLQKNSRFFNSLEEMIELLKKEIKLFSFKGAFKGNGYHYTPRLVNQFFNEIELRTGYKISEGKVVQQLLKQTGYHSEDELEAGARWLYMAYAPGGTEVDHFRVKDTYMKNANYDIKLKDVLE